MNKYLAIIVVSKEGYEKGKTIFEHFKNSRMFVPYDLFKHELDSLQGIYSYKSDLKNVIRLAFYNFSGVIIIGSVGITVRLLAPFLQNKVSDPGVVAVDQEGCFAVSVLSGHLGGGNKLAKEVSEILTVKPVITTASDLGNKVTPDLLAYLWNLKIEGIEKQHVKELLKHINSHIVKGNQITWMVDEKLNVTTDFINFQLWRNERIKESEQPVVLITDRVLTHKQLSKNVIILRPKSIIAGLGCKKGVLATDILEYLHTNLIANGVSPLCLKSLVSIDKKKSELGLLEAARYLKVDLKFFNSNELIQFVNKKNASEFVNKKMGVGGVCEPAVMKLCKDIITRKTASRDKKITIALGRVGWPQWASDLVEERAYH
ncbi:cobalt-precorrin 5A hydrolase [Natranaerobius trueperi]|uniref:Cobalamin biosynthesis protein CbiG n=1 Tax=Natranaerobius trueperi TaxID=759412 RepID=A0A226BXB6_9FIRM|nr:cobalamin biosynthesis protein [Natranaerobius trueperi]OWZ82974.1 hypothetical protein CDO51_11105 [Natranaerobius trueperi]